MNRNIVGKFCYKSLKFSKQNVALVPEIMREYDRNTGFFTAPDDGNEGNTWYISHKNMKNDIDTNSNATYVKSYKGYDFFIDEYLLNGKTWYRHS